jgi:transposase
MNCTPFIRQNKWGVFMSKILFDEKLEAVLRVVNGGMSVSASSRMLGVDSSCLVQWINLYQEQGPQSLLNSGASYNGQFKVMVVEYMHANHLSSYKTAARFGIKCRANVSKWERIYYEEGPEGLLRTKPRGRPPKSMTKNKNAKKELSKQTKEDLIAEVQRLIMENEYLKKLRALVQERIDRENGNVPPSSKN